MVHDRRRVAPRLYGIAFVVKAVPEIDNASLRARILSDEVPDAHSVRVVYRDGDVSVLGQVVCDLHRPRRAEVGEMRLALGEKRLLPLRRLPAPFRADDDASPSVERPEHEDAVDALVADSVRKPLRRALPSLVAPERLEAERERVARRERLARDTHRGPRPEDLHVVSLRVVPRRERDLCAVGDHVDPPLLALVGTRRAGGVVRRRVAVSAVLVVDAAARVWTGVVHVDVHLVLVRSPAVEHDARLVAVPPPGLVEVQSARRVHERRVVAVAREHVHALRVPHEVGPDGVAVRDGRVVVRKDSGREVPVACLPVDYDLSRGGHGLNLGVERHRAVVGERGRRGYRGKDRGGQCSFHACVSHVHIT